MIIRIFKRIFVAIFLFSVLLHAVLFFEDIVIPRIINTSYCKNESLLLSFFDDCSPISVYLKPRFYLAGLSCIITGGRFEQDSSYEYTCLARPIPLLIDPSSPFYSPSPPESSFEKVVKEVKSASLSFLYFYYTISLLPISAVIFLAWMFADCVTRPIPKKGACLALILFGYVYGGLIYYFVGRKRFRVSTTKNPLDPLDKN